MTQVVDVPGISLRHPVLVEDLDAPLGETARPSRLPAFVARPLELARSVPNLGIYLGVALLAAGFILIAVAWHLVSEHILVAAQLPYLVSAGFPGVGLVVCGVAAIAMTVKSKETAVKRAQVQELLATQQQIRAALEKRQGA